LYNLATALLVIGPVGMASLQIEIEIAIAIADSHVDVGHRIVFTGAGMTRTRELAQGTWHRFDSRRLIPTEHPSPFRSSLLSS